MPLIPLLKALVCATAIIGAQTQPAPKTITYETKAKLLSAVLVDLSRQTGLLLTADDVLSKQPIIISVTDASQKDLLAHIAKASYGHWNQTEQGFQLNLDQDAVRAAVQARHDRRVKAIQKQLAEVASALQKTGPMTEQKARDYAKSATKTQMNQPGIPDGINISKNNAGMSPADRALDEALLSIGAENLATLTQDDRPVFSTNPNAVQRPIGDASGQIMQEYLAGVIPWNKALGQVPHEQTEMDKVYAMMPQMADMLGGPKQGTTKATKMLITMSQFFGTSSARLAVYDDTHKVADQANQPIMASLFSRFQMNEDDAKAPAAKADNTAPIEMSPESKWIAKQGGPMGFGLGDQGVIVLGSPLSKMEVPPPALLKELMRPDLYDPLSFVESEKLLGTAKLGKLNVVAMLPDSVSEAPMPGLEAADTVDAVRMQLKTLDSLTVKDEGGWIDVCPSDPEKALHQRTNRADLAQLLHGMTAAKGSKLDALAAYFAPHFREPAALTQKYIAVCVPGKLLQTWSIAALAFYGSLPSIVRDGLTSGGSVRVGDLPPATVQLVGYMAYSGKPGMKLAKPEVKHEPSVMDLMADESDLFSFMFTNDEPTEELPNGISPDAVLALEPDKDPPIRVALSADAMGGQAMGGQAMGGSSGMMMDMSPQMMATFMTAKDDPKFAKFAPPANTLKEMRLVSVRALNFRIQFASGLIGAIHLREKSDPSEQTYTWDSVPESFRKATADWEAKAKQMMANFPDPSKLMPMGKNQNPPP